MGNDLNAFLQNLMSFKQAGRNPAQLMQMMMQRNPQYNQLMTTLQNMAQGRNPRDFVVQLARQNGVSEQNIQQMLQIIS